MAAVNVLHREERPSVLLADLVDLNDVRMLEPGYRLDLDTEAGQLFRERIREHHLESHNAVELLLPRLINDAHAAAAQTSQDLVAGHRGPAPGCLSPYRCIFDPSRRQRVRIRRGG